MDFKPKFYKTHPLSLVVRLESVINKTGDVMFAVTLANGEKENVHYLFKSLSSAIDFVSSNFG